MLQRVAKYQLYFVLLLMLMGGTAVYANSPLIHFYQQEGGAVDRAAIVQGDIIYSGAGTTELRIYQQTSQAIQPIATHPFSGRIRQILIHNQRAYVAIESGVIHLVDVSSPANPLPLGMVPGNAGMQIRGHYLFTTSTVCCSIGGSSTFARIYDLADGVLPHDVTPAGLAQSSQRFRLLVRGEHLYVSNGLSSYQIWHVPTPATASLVGTQAGELMALQDDYLVVKTAPNETQLLQLQNPAQPTVWLTIPYELRLPLQIVNNDVYAVTVQDGVEQLQRFSPVRPAQSSLFVPDYAGMVLVDGLVYVATDSDVYGVNQELQQVYTYNGEQDIAGVTAVNNRLLLTLANGSITNMSVRLNPLQQYEASFPSDPQTVFATEDHLFVTQSSDQAQPGFYIYDKTLQTQLGYQPLTTDQRTAPDTPFGLVVHNDLAFVGEDNSLRLRIFDVSNPATISEIFSQNWFAPDLDQLFYDDGVLYAVGTQVTAVDVSDPTAPSVGGSLEVNAYDALWADAHLYTVDLTGIKIVAGGLNPSVVSTIPLAQVTDISVAEDVLYALTSHHTIHEFDLSDVANPQMTNSWTLPDNLFADTIEQKGDYLYVVGQQGLSLLYDQQIVTTLADSTMQSAIIDKEWVYALSRDSGIRLFQQDGFYEASGRVQDVYGHSLFGVTVHLDDGRSMVTGSDGRYAFSYLAPLTRTVTPMINDLTFWPPVRTVRPPLDMLNGHFTLVAPPTSATVSQTLTITNMQGLPTLFDFGGVETAVTITPNAVPDRVGYHWGKHAFIAETDISQTVTITLTYNNLDYGDSDYQEQTLMLWQQTEDGWQIPPCANINHNTITNELSVTTCGLAGQYALFYLPEQPAYTTYLPFVARLATPQSTAGQWLAWFPLNQATGTENLLDTPVDASCSPCGLFDFEGLSLQNKPLTLGNPALLNFEGAITFEAWVRPVFDAQTTGTQYILSHESTSNPSGLLMRINYSTGQYSVGSVGESGLAFLAHTPILPQDNGAWVHLTGVYDGTQWLIYRNGQLGGSADAPLGAVMVDGSWRIGADGDGERPFAGRIAHVRIGRGHLAGQSVWHTIRP